MKTKIFIRPYAVSKNDFNQTSQFLDQNEKKKNLSKAAFSNAAWKITCVWQWKNICGNGRKIIESKYGEIIIEFSVFKCQCRISFVSIFHWNETRKFTTIFFFNFSFLVHLTLATCINRRVYVNTNTEHEEHSW